MKEKLEVLMSVMHQDSFDVAYRTGIKTDLLVINQCDRNDYTEIVVDSHLWRMISTTERGLSKSRNMALRNAKGDICLLCDDDETMNPDYADIILHAFRELDDAAAVVFNVNRINYRMKKKYYAIKAVRQAPWYRGYSSQMLAMKRDIITGNKILFNEKFGSGTPWGGGEEILLEKDIRRLKKKIYEYPATIATVDYSGESEWFHGYTEMYFYNLGAFQRYMYRDVLLRELRRLYDCYKLRREKDLSPIQKMYWMHLGARGIKKDVTYKEFVARRRPDR